MIDENFQDMTLACMQRVPEFNAIACAHLSPEIFDGAVRKNLCKMMIDFWVSYDTLVSDRIVVNVLGDMTKEGKITSVEMMPHARKWKELKSISIAEWKYVLDKLVSFLKHQKIKHLIEESVKKHLPKDDYSKIEQEMAKIAGITTNNNVQPYDYFSEDKVRERSATRKEELMKGKSSISTGIKALDDRLHANGFYQKELYIFMAPPKRGKSMSLLWFSNQAALQGYNVAHFTCEVSKEICSLRLDAMNAKVTIKDMKTQFATAADHIVSRIPRGKLMLFEYPTKSLSPQMVSHQVDRMRSEFNINTNMIVVDYLDIMRLNGPKGDSSWSDQGPLAEELRGLAGMFVVPVVTATQINRGGSDKAVTSGKDVAGNYEKIMIADEIFSLSATKEELAEGILRISNTESRNSEGGTIVISTKFAYGQFFSEFIETEI